jgi:hypothetical protein
VPSAFESIHIAVGDREAIARAIEYPPEETLLLLPSQRVRLAFIAGRQLRAGQHTARELEGLELALDQLEVGVVELFAEHGEEPREPGRAELRGMLLGDRVQTPEKAGEHALAGEALSPQPHLPASCAAHRARRCRVGAG